MNAKEKRQVRGLMAALDKFCDLNDGMPIRQAMALLSVALQEAEHGEAELREVGKDTQSPSQVVSRDLLGLGKRTRTGKAGLDLVRSFEDYNDLRRKPYKLTPAGKRFMKTILEAL